MNSLALSSFIEVVRDAKKQYFEPFDSIQYQSKFIQLFENIVSILKKKLRAKCLFITENGKQVIADIFDHRLISYAIKIDEILRLSQKKKKQVQIITLEKNI